MRGVQKPNQQVARDGPQAGLPASVQVHGSLRLQRRALRLVQLRAPDEEEAGWMHSSPGSLYSVKVGLLR